MPKRSSNKKQDLNERAFSVIQKLTGQMDRVFLANDKNPAAVELGRLGGLKGGKARAEKLSAKKRSEIAQKAAEARWAKK